MAWGVDLYLANLIVASASNFLVRTPGSVIATAVNPES